ncbi:molybdenum cofactor biosynthesis protein F [Mariannaea sp. PMI_226]|nr:molybdenum cofactor biosynthesis protein F [Mariannaea sp. PMI_226]
MAPAATPSVSDFVPIADWPTLEEMADGFREHLMPASDKLQGKSFQHTFENGCQISHVFASDSLTWKILEGEGKGLTGQAQYEAFEVRPDMFLVDFLKPDYNELVTLVVDLSTGQAIAGVSGFRDQDGERRTYTSFMNAQAYGASAVQAFPPTEDLIGKHILYRYTPRDSYEHIYLNKGTFVWHCLSGTEKGLADAEECRMLKLRDNLYLLFWTETIMPVESIVVIDLENMRSTGRFYCWDPKPKRAVHVRFGSYATVLAETTPQKTLQQVSQEKAVKREK